SHVELLHPVRSEHRRTDDVRRGSDHLTMECVDAADLEVCIPRVVLRTARPGFTLRQMNAEPVALDDAEHGGFADAVAHGEPKRIPVVRQAPRDASDQEPWEHCIDPYRGHRLTLRYPRCQKKKRNPISARWLRPVSAAPRGRSPKVCHTL